MFMGIRSILINGQSLRLYIILTKQSAMVVVVISAMICTRKAKPKKLLFCTKVCVDTVTVILYVTAVYVTRLEVLAASRELFKVSLSSA